MPDNDDRVVARASDGLRKPKCVVGKSEPSPIARDLEPRRVDLDHRRMRSEGRGQLGEVPVNARPGARNEQDARFAGAAIESHRAAPSIASRPDAEPWDVIAGGAGGTSLSRAAQQGGSPPEDGRECDSEPCCRNGQADVLREHAACIGSNHVAPEAALAAELAAEVCRNPGFPASCCVGLCGHEPASAGSPFVLGVNCAFRVAGE